MSRLLRIGLLAALLGALAPGAVLAQQPLTVTTPYPAITADPGGTARFTLRISTEAPARVDLAVTNVPPGWTPRLRGDGTTISAVYSDGVEPREATLEVDIPREALPDEYEIVVQASGAGTTTQLPLSVTIESAEQGSVELTSQFPVLRGPSDATFRYDLTLRNDTNEEKTFSIEAFGPTGWQVTAQPAGEEQAATAVVAAGATSRITVTVDPAPQAPAGQYPIIVRASGGPEPVETQLGLEITGTYAMALSTQDERLNTRVSAGAASSVTLIVSNTGTAALENVELSAEAPSEWQTTFDSPTIQQLEAGRDQSVVLTIEPANNAVAGDYLVTVNANSEQATGELQLRTTVETSPLWGVVGLALLAVVGLGLLLVFRRYGRR